MANQEIISKEIKREESKSDTFIFYINGRKIEDPCLDPGYTLLQYLREKLRLPGTKLACGEGGCGACTVMVSKYNADTKDVRHYTVNACLAPIASMHGLAVTTTEGIGSTKTRLHPVQERLAKAHGSQCGFCTPGFVMSMYTLLRNNPKPSMDEIEENLVGNLCRCTGYRPILEGFRTFSEEANEVNGCGRSDCCKLNTNSCLQNNIIEEDNSLEKTDVLFDPNMFAPYDPTQEVIFPPDLKLNADLPFQSCVFRGPETTFYRPGSFQELLTLKQTYPDAKIVIGNTEVGIEVKFKNQNYPVNIYPANVAELLVLKVQESYVEVGAAVPLTTIEVEFRKLLKKLPEHKTKVLRSIIEMLTWFAGRQIRNVAAFGGNIMTGSPISDLNPIFMTAGAILSFSSVDGERDILFDNKFYTGYRKNCAKPNEVLRTVKIPWTLKDEYFYAYKQARRKDDDIAIVNAAMKVSIDPHLKITSLSLAFGGMAPTTIMADTSMKELIGYSWNEELLEKAVPSLLDELKLHPGSPGGMINYRRALTASFFFKFFLSVRQELHAEYPILLPPFNNEEKELIKDYNKGKTKSTQFFQNVPADQEKIDPIGRPIPHLSSLKQTTGEAEYVDDIPRFENELYAALVMSTRAHAKILDIDESEALAIEGVELFISSKDIPGANLQGIGDKAEEIMASTLVHFVGEVIGIIVADTQKTAQRAAKLVKVSYEDLPNPVFTIEEAIQANSMWDPIVVESGDVMKALQEADFILEGKSYIGGQEHFYMETNVHIAIPHEGDEMELICSSQSPAFNQESAALALGIPSHLVTCKVRRIGGGFGGKETRTKMISTPIAVAAAKLKRPVRIILDRDEDMVLTGGRHPFLNDWKVGFNKNGKLTALDLRLYSNAGCSFDLSGGVMYKAVFGIDNVYKIENVNVSGFCCKTNLPSNTAFRGFGAPQASYVIEDILARISDFLKIHPNEVRTLNMYKDVGDSTYFGQSLEECQARRCWEQVVASSNYNEREMLVKEFNRNNSYIKRGISAIPCKFSVAFGLPDLNQGGALVLVYKDGSVLASIGGTEMGQGLYTKMVQIVARVFKIPINKVYITDTSTDKVPNASPTAASASSDLYGMAVLNACEEIMKRLQPYITEKADRSWEEIVTAAYMDRVSLSATGFYKMPNLKPYSLKERTGIPFSYFTYGAAVSEVEIDCLTGDHVVLRTDIVMDVGNSLNPAIDIGQIEGAFLQGYGLFTIEQLVYSRTGALLTKGPGAYKIPSVMDIPREFNVAILRNSSNPRAIYSSKAIGEPPFFSGASVFFAIREAVKAASGEFFDKGTYSFDSPATAERIRMACKDRITKLVEISEERKSEGWSLNI